MSVTQGTATSGLGREAWTIEAFGGDVAAVVEELDLEQVILMGHSMGGDVIIEAARRLPGRVQGLVWLDTYRQPGNPSTPEQIETFLAPFHADFEETTRKFVRGLFPPDAEESLVESVAADMEAAPKTVALGALESSFSYSRTVTQPLQELDAPVVAINAEDPPTDIESMERYGVAVVLMPGRRIGKLRGSVSSRGLAVQPWESAPQNPAPGRSPPETHFPGSYAPLPGRSQPQRAPSPLRD